MPNRYEREIEEILSRMEDSEPRRGLGDRIRPMQRPPSRAHSLPTIHLHLVDALILLSIFLAIIAAGLAYFDSDLGIVSGIIGAVALILFVVALVVGWRDRFRPPTTAKWRGSSYVEVTPLRRGFFGAIATQFRVMRLRLYYRRAQRDNDEN